MTLPFEAAVATFDPPLPLAVALSGGADSTALLLACVRRWPAQVVAIHVHHGLQAAADGFEAHCRALCERLNVPLAVCHVNAHAPPGHSPEDAARRARYRAISEHIHRFNGVLPAPSTTKNVALAHHADDQAETLLLALSRGAGLPGLAAMPTLARRHGLIWHRPLLSVRGDDIRAWLRAQGQTWVQDPTNGDTRYTRNRIRASLLPALQTAFPQFRATFARSAAHAAQAQAVLDEVAAADWAQVRGAQDAPQIAALQTLSLPRQANVLRHWLKTRHGTTPSAAQLAEIQNQINACTTRGHRIELKAGAGRLYRDGQVLAFAAVQARGPHAPTTRAPAACCNAEKAGRTPL